jgi:hypothetical protein
LTFDVLKILEQEGFVINGEDNLVHAEKAFFAARVVRWIRAKIKAEPDFNLNAHLTMLLYYKTGMADLKFTKNEDKLLCKMKKLDQEVQEIVDSIRKNDSQSTEQHASTSATEDTDGNSDP